MSNSPSDRGSSCHTLRSLEKLLGVSRTTISAALRGASRVNQVTAAKIRAAAAAAGYLYNPLAGSLMSEMRRSSGSSFRGTIAIVTAEEPERPTYASQFHEQLLRGARQRAQELGFETELFTVGSDALPITRLDQILRARGINGVILLPTWRTPNYLGLSWEHYTGVYLDYRIQQPPLRSICCDHYESLMTALEKIRALGYNRPGLFLPRQHDARLHHRWEAAFLAYQQNYSRGPKVPPLVVDEINEAVFARWFQRHQPDVVIGHIYDAVGWMKKCGAKIPATHGFFCLNLMNTREKCAGLDQAPDQIGARASEVLVAQLHRNDRGVPVFRSMTTLPARWVDGPTLRKKITRVATAPTASGATSLAPSRAQKVRRSLQKQA